MKAIKVLLSLIGVVAVLFASAFPGSAIGFQAEEVYASVFVIYSGSSLGSGFAVGSNCIVTNAHVIEDSRSVQVKTYGGEQYKASILGMDQDRDIAVLAIDGGEFPYLPIADMAKMNTGDDIYAIGAPKSMAYTLTKGVISAKERTIGRNSYIQIDAAINNGNSGGPLLNDDGEVLGMNTLKMTDSEGIGMAIPVSVICAYLGQLGLELDAAGNVVNTPQLPQEDTQPPTQSEDRADSERVPASPEKEGLPVITYVALAVAGLSLAGNVILYVSLDREKKKNQVVQYDPKERTDFEIEVWE